MALEQAIRNFTDQLTFAPAVTNSGKLPALQRFTVVGMGGSNHATDILKAWKPLVDVIVHRDYGLPAASNADRLVIACSYSGNTEEPIDAFDVAQTRELPVAVIASGGALLARAQRTAVPHIVIP